MSGKIILVRHAHGLHNVNNDPSIPDPKLTLLGETQAVGLIKHNPGSDFSSVGCIYTSPLKRSTHTTLLAFIDVADKSFYLRNEGGRAGGAELILEPLLQELGNEPANTGSDIAALKELWPKLDFKTLGSLWPAKDDPLLPNLSSPDVRAATFLKALQIKSTQLLAKGGKTDIVIMTHSGFSQALTDSDVNLGLTEAKICKIVESSGKLKLQI